MNTTKTHFKYITAAMMFILLAVFLTDNPIKGSSKDIDGHQDLAIYLCIFYAITAVWFWNNTLDQKTKSKILLLRLNTPEAIAFFDKWNARENGEDDSTSQTTKMIIDTPKIVGDINFENVFNSSALEK